MNQERPLIKLYRTRTFSEKMSDTFDFVRENWRTMLKFLTYMMLPLALVQTFAMNNFMTGFRMKGSLRRSSSMWKIA